MSNIWCNRCHKLLATPWCPDCDSPESQFKQKDERIAALELQLAEANRDRERANMLAQDLIGQLQQRLVAAEAQLAEANGRAKAWCDEAGKVRHELHQDHMPAVPGYELSAVEMARQLRAKLAAAEARESRLRTDLARIAERLGRELSGVTSTMANARVAGVWGAFNELESALRPAAEQPDRDRPSSHTGDVKTIGLHKKYDVRRTDGKDGIGKKHHNCNYFVLDLSCDEHAFAALEAYANSCETDNPTLAREIREWVDAREIHWPEGT